MPGWANYMGTTVNKIAQDPDAYDIELDDYDDKPKARSYVNGKRVCPQVRQATG